MRQAYSGAFNTAIQNTLAGYAADGVIVHYLNGTEVLARIAADPSDFGLTSAGPCPAAQATNCVTNPTFSNQYLFYVDALHLTSAGFAILGQYVAATRAATVRSQWMRYGSPSLTNVSAVTGRGVDSPSNPFASTITPNSGI